MEAKHEHYEGHQIELREGERTPQLLIDAVPIRYGQLPDGRYFLHEYAYHWTEDLMELAKKFIAYRRNADEVRRGRKSQSEAN